MRYIWKRCFAALLSVALVFALLPAAALAEEADGATGQTAVEQAQDLIDALPDAETITADNRADVEAQLAAIDEAKLALTDDEISSLDVTRYDAAVSALSALDGQAGDDVPTPLADSGTLDGGFTWTLDGTTLTLTGSDELKKDYLANGPWNQDEILTVIVNGATSIGESCFEGRTNLQSITLPGTLQAIGKSAFKNCSSLTFVSLPDGLASIGNEAFRGCEVLVLTELPSELVSIGEQAFRDCKALVLTALPEGLTSISEQAFRHCDSLVLTKLPSRLESIGKQAFLYCGSLELTEIPNGVTSIGDYAFQKCESITHLTLPAGLKNLGRKAFVASGVITLIFLGEKAPEIQQDTFDGAGYLKEILIPAGAEGYTDSGWPADKVKAGYKVTIEAAEHGSASASSTFASEGTQITLTAEPEAWYHLQEWTTDQEVVDDVFTMPDSDVTVTPVFEPHEISNGECSVCHEQIFEGLGTAESPYLIPNLSTLIAFREYVNNDSDHGQNEYFQLTGNIDLGGNSENQWTPICWDYRGTTKFYGTFDGGNCTISGLYINTYNSYQGLFGCIGDGGTVKNLTVDGNIACGPDVGGIAGRIKGEVLIDNCSNAGKISGSGSIVGGIAGYFDDNKPTIKNCRNTGDINSSTITGGITGTNKGIITGCYNTGAITGSGNIGGIAGSNSGTINNCYNTGDISGIIPAGGIAGSSGNGTVEKCYNTGNVTATGDLAPGGVVGQGPCTECFYLEGTADKATGNEGESGASKKSAGEFRFLASALGEGWADSVKGRPVLISNPEAEIIDGSTPYEIPDLDTLKAFRDYINSSTDGGSGKTFRLMNSIELDSDENAPWKPIGNRNFEFQGTFDGNDYKISNLYVRSKTGGYEFGFFGYIGKDGTVKNLSISGDVIGNSFVGGIAGYNDGTISNCSFDGSVTSDSSAVTMVGGITSSNEGAINNCKNSGSVTNHSTDVGGIVGTNQGPVTNCSNSGTITGTGSNTNAGGIMGSNSSDDPVTGCINTGDINAPKYPAGIVSYNGSDSVITNCYNDGKISASDNYSGGIAGNNHGIITNCYNAGCVGESCKYSGGIVESGYKGTIENCYNSGIVNGTSPGNIIGNAYKDIINNCYFLEGLIDNSAGSGNHTGEATEKSSEQFASGEVAWLLQNGQGEQVWGQNLKGSADEYPVLTNALEKKVCKVTFHTEGQAEYAVEYTNYNGKVELPTDPTLDGTVFDHWSTAEDTSGGGTFDNNTTVTEDITVYAVGRETFGGESDEIALTTIYGTELAEDLSKHIEYKSGTETTGKFEYKITSGNDLLEATIEGDNLKIPGTANVGDYTLTIVAKEKEPQYSLISVGSYDTTLVTLTVKVTVAKATVTFEVSGNVHEYIGTPQKATVTQTAPDGLKLTESDNYEVYYTSQGASGAAGGTTAGETEVGIYDVWVKLTSDTYTNYMFKDDKQEAKVGELTISTVVATCVAPEANNLTYTREAQELVTAGTPTGGDMRYALGDNDVTQPGDEQFGDAVPSGTAAGTYYVWYYVKADANHTNSEKKCAEVTIEKAEVTFTVSGNTVDYDTEAHTATVTQTADESPKLNPEDFSVTYGTENAESKTDAGSYEIHVKLNNNNFKFNDEDNETREKTLSEKLTIKQAALELDVNGSDITYGDLLSESELNGTATLSNGTKIAGTWAWDEAADSTYPTVFGSNSYKVTFTPSSGAGNFTDASKSTTITVSVSPFTLTPQVESVDSKIYDGNVTAQNGKLKFAEDLNRAPFNTNTPTASGSFEFTDKNVGKNKSVKVTGITISATEPDNYRLSTTAIESTETSAEITAKEVTLTWSSPTEFTYNGEEQGVTVTVNTGVDGESLTATLKGNTATDAGSYTAEATGLEDSENGDADNYKLPGTTTQGYTIKKATVSVTVQAVTGKYGEEITLTAQVTANDVDTSLITGEVTFKAGETELGKGIKGADNKWTLTLTKADSEKEKALFDAKNVTADYAGNDNIERKDGSNTATIEPRELKYTVTADGREYLPGSTEVTVHLTPTDFIEGDDVTLTATGNLSKEDVGTYESVNLTEITIGGTDKAYYTVAGTADNVTLTSPVTISQIKAVVENPPTGETGLTYTGDPLRLLTGGGTSTGGTMQYYVGEKGSTERPDGTADWKESISDITATDAGTYTIWYRANGNIDYATSDLGSIEITISKAAPTVSVQAITGTYGEDITVTAKVTVSGVAENLINGTIQFEDGDTTLGTADVQDGTAILTVSGAERDKQHALFGTAGSSTVTAAYSGNGNIEGESGNGDAAIGPRELQYTVTAEDKTFDGKSDVSVTLTPSNTLSGDQVSLTAVGAVESPVAGTYNTIDLTDITLSGEDARYYTVETEKTGVELTSPVNITRESTGALQGQVTEGGNPVANATVTLKQGGETVATTTTGADGSYFFEDVEPGIYEIVVEAEDKTKTMTSMVEYTEETGAEKDLELPVEDVSSVLDTEKAPDSVIAVGGLDDVASDNAETGSTVTVTMTVESKTESTAEYAQEIKSAAGNRNLDYLEIGLEKTTAATGGAPTIEPLTETTQPITIVLRFDFTGKDNVVVYRYHGTAVDTLTETNNSNGEYIVLDEAGGTVTLHVKNFSTYAIGYSLTGQTPTPPAPPSSYPSYYSVTVPSDIEGGNVTADRTSAQQGSKITLTVEPDEGYHFGSLTVNDRNGKPVEVTDNGDGTYTFAMPYGKVTVEAEFVKCGSLDFTDLDTGAWYHEYSDYVIAHGLMQGTGGGLFEPGGTVTRAQMVTVLWNMSGDPVVNYYMTYPDVSEEAWYAEAVRWATSEGIADGYGNGKFGPDDPLTREQMAVMLYRYEKKYGDGGFTGDWMYRLPFTDLDQISDWAFEAVAWCNMKGIIKGKDENIFDPKGPAKRSELAAILERYCREDDISK